MELGLVGYTEQQREDPARPGDLYDPSPLFRAARAYCQHHYDEWLIVSAKHGVLEPEGPPIAPYEETLYDASVPHRQNWARRVRGQLTGRELDPDDTTFVMHTGPLYVEELRPLLSAGGASVELPLGDRGHDERLAWYEERTR